MREILFAFMLALSAVQNEPGPKGGPRIEAPQVAPKVNVQVPQVDTPAIRVAPQQGPRTSPRGEQRPQPDGLIKLPGRFDEATGQRLPDNQRIVPGYQLPSRQPERRQEFQPRNDPRQQPRAGVDIRLGDRDFDRNGLGRLDEDRHRPRDRPDDNSWRRRYYHGRHFYWHPQGHWVYWHNSQWIPYVAETYVVPQTYAVPFAAADQGPYYEDRSGNWYLLRNGQRYYDRSVQRILTTQ